MALVWYNHHMAQANFYLPIQIRYADLDPQWHVNHARILSLMEHARTQYLIRLGLFDGKTFSEFPTIVANINISYVQPIEPDQKIAASVKVIRIGNKSITYRVDLVDENSGQVMAHCETVTVAYDYRNKRSMSVPQAWRDTISQFEGVSL